MKLFKKLFQRLPSKWRQKLIRRMIELPDDIPEGITFKIAETHEELESAFKLVYESYLQLGYCDPNPYKMRATVHHALPSTATLIAVLDSRVIGTLTIVRDNRLRLPMEKCFSVDPLRTKGSRIAEITSLVIDRNYRRQKGGAVLFPLLKLMYTYATEYFGVNHLAVLVHPKDADFYRGLMIFESVPGTKTEMYLGADAVALHLDLKLAPERFRTLYRHSQMSKNLYHFFVERDVPNIALPERLFHKINDPLVTLEYFQQLFVEKLKLYNSRDDLERRRVEDYLIKSEHRRMEQRHDIETHGLVCLSDDLPGIPILIKDVSRRGFRCYLEQDIPLQRLCRIVINVGPQKYAYLQAKAVWKNSKTGAGFEVSLSDGAWYEFLTYLYRNQLGKIA